MVEYRLFLIGDDAVAIAPDDRRLRHSLARSLRQTGDWIDVVPGKEVVAVRFDPMRLYPSEALQRVGAWLEGFRAEDSPDGETVDLHMEVSEDCAPDLQVLAEKNGLPSEAFLDKIIKSDLIIDMLGFTPGFAYVEGVDPSLGAERLATPRQRVATGSVGLVNGQLGLYGLAGPGGWPIIGRLRDTLFDPAREPPFLLQEGQKIRLHLVGL